MNAARVPLKRTCSGLVKASGKKSLSFSVDSAPVSPESFKRPGTARVISSRVRSTSAKGDIVPAADWAASTIQSLGDGKPQFREGPPGQVAGVRHLQETLTMNLSFMERCNLLEGDGLGSPALCP